MRGQVALGDTLGLLDRDADTTTMRTLGTSGVRPPDAPTGVGLAQERGSATPDVVGFRLGMPRSDLSRSG